MVDPAEIRSLSRAFLASRAWTLPPDSLPFLDTAGQPKTAEQILSRVGATSAVLAVACGCQRPVARRWLRDEGLSDALSPRERDVLDDDVDDLDDVSQTAETLYALAWSVGLIAGADDLGTSVPDTLITAVPHPPPRPRAVAAVRSRIAPVGQLDLLRALDLTYCLDWAIVDGRLRGEETPSSPSPMVVVGRRHALEWILGDELWDDVSMDT